MKRNKNNKPRTARPRVRRKTIEMLSVHAKLILITVSIAFSSCKESTHRKIIRYDDNGNVQSEKWLRWDNILDGPNIMYYPNGEIEGMGIVKNGLINGKIVSYYENGNLELLTDIKDTKIKNGYSYKFYRDKKLKGIFYYRNDTALYIKQFDTLGNITSYSGHLPINDLKPTELKILNTENVIKRNQKTQVLIRKYGCSYEALNITTNNGKIIASETPGVYWIYTNTLDSSLILSVMIYSYNYNASFVDDFTLKVN